MRLFISIDFPKEICQKLSTRVPELDDWRKTAADKIHLTLFFIGDCTVSENAHLSMQLSEISFTSFQLKTGPLGVFPNQNNPKLLWCGLQESEPLLMLQEKIAERAGRFRNKKESKPFKPHITLARRKSGHGKDAAILRHLDETFDPLTVRVDSFHLKQSILKPEGAEYVNLKTFRAQ
ncbi:MAG: RNA 2',3'-cyclic phosphodiesterase [Balneolaceae bacterium]|nr:RNA 2',3'-cyclic phosphodiesterase [Balneolaceae bacterium]